MLKTFRRRHALLWIDHDELRDEILGEVADMCPNWGIEVVRTTEQILKIGDVVLTLERIPSQEK